MFHYATTKFYILNALPLSYQVSIHSSCVCNELVALHNRHLIDRTYLPFDRVSWRRAQGPLPLRQLMRAHPLAIVKTYSGGKRRMYYNAWLNLQQHGLQKSHSYVNMFIKPDKYSSDAINDKMPRAIQYRSKEFNLLLATYLQPIEHYVYSNLVLNRRRVIVKGLSPMARGMLLVEKMKDFTSPVYIEVDHSKFDSTIRVEHLRTIHKYYKQFYPRSKQFNYLLECQINNVGYTKGGIKYKVRGTRMSGDYDTGLGNSLINYHCLYGFVKHLDYFDFILDGDDSIIIVEEDDIGKLDFDHFGRVGFETKYCIKRDIHTVDFCQCRLMTVPIPNFVRNPIRALSSANIKLSRVSPSKYREWAAGLGACELALNPGVPILQMLGFKLFRSNKRYWLDQDMRFRMGACKRRFTLVSEMARYQFYRCWGIEPWKQELTEAMITGPMYLEREIQDSAEYVSPTSTILRTASAYANLGTSCS